MAEALGCTALGHRGIFCAQEEQLASAPAAFSFLPKPRSGGIRDDPLNCSADCAAGKRQPGWLRSTAAAALHKAGTRQDQFMADRYECLRQAQPRYPTLTSTPTEAPQLAA